MKTTKTVEIEICDQCGDEVNYPHLEACAHCGKEICTKCSHSFRVDVREVIPRRVNMGHGDVWAQSVRYADEFSYNGTFCGHCGNEIGKMLVAARLGKTPRQPEESGSAVLDSVSM